MIDRTPPSAAHRGPRVTKVCVICQAEYLIVPMHAGVYLTCSKECSSALKSMRRRDVLIATACHACGCPMEVPQWRVARGLNKYCSDACRMVGLNSAPRHKTPRGKSWLHPRGYMRCWVWNGTQWRQVMEHRWVMEQHLGRPLNRAERIHHINGDRTDNRIENLRLYPSHAAHLRAEHPELIHNIAGH